jgi:hypothetical protein
MPLKEIEQHQLKRGIPKLLEDACFRTLEKNMFKAPLFINGYSLIK